MLFVFEEQRISRLWYVVHGWMARQVKISGNGITHWTTFLLLLRIAIWDWLCPRLVHQQTLVWIRSGTSQTPWTQMLGARWAVSPAGLIAKCAQSFFFQALHAVSQTCFQIGLIKIRYRNQSRSYCSHVTWQSLSNSSWGHLPKWISFKSCRCGCGLSDSIL